jgi:Skp family chaperone for outer membrane proteins
MKKSFYRFTALLAAMVVFGFAFDCRAETRIATIDLRKVFDKYYKRAQAEQNFKDKGMAVEKEEKGMLDDYQKSKDEYEKLLAAANDQSVTPAERDKRKTVAETKLLDIKGQENSIKRFEENANEQLGLQRKKMIEQLLEDIRVAINAKARSAGYTMVVDTAAESMNQSPVVLYSDGSNDLTETILKQLNAAAPVFDTNGPSGVIGTDLKK